MGSRRNRAEKVEEVKADSVKVEEVKAETPAPEVKITSDDVKSQLAALIAQLGDDEVLGAMKEVRVIGDQLKKEASKDRDAKMAQLSALIDAWGIDEIDGTLNFYLEKHGRAVTYVGLFNADVETEIIRRINNSKTADKTADFAQEDILHISKMPDIDCKIEDVKRTIKALVNSGSIATYNPDKKRGRNSTYHLAPKSAPDTPVDPATIRGATESALMATEDSD